MSEKLCGNIETENRIRSLIEDAFQSIFHTYSIRISTSTENGDNFLGFIYDVTVDGYKKNQENVTFNLIAKLAPHQANFRRLFPIKELYGREIFLYDTIMPELVKFQKEKTNSGACTFVKHYITSTTNNEEGLILENMKSKGFKIGNRREGPDYPHALLVVRELGKFHALSYAIKDQKPEVFKRWTSQCKSIFYSHPTAKYFTKAITNLGKAVLNVCNENKTKTDAFDKYLNNLPNLFPDILSVEKAESYEVLNHGDVQMRNLLFKYGDSSQPNVPTEMCMIDWQLAQIGSPALDILYFIFICSEKELRKQHYEDLIREYYKSLSSTLLDLGSDPETLLPFEILLKHLKKFSAFGLYCALANNAGNKKESVEIPEFMYDILSEDNMVEILSILPANGYIEQMHDLIQDIIRYDYDF